MHDTPSSPSKSKKLHRVRKVATNRKFLMILAAVVVLAGTFYAGSVYGASQEKKDSKSASSADATTRSSRWTTVGTVVEVTDKKIKVKDSRDQEKEATVSDDTQITDRKGNKLTIGDIKKDQRVIVSGEKDGNNLKATRIRLQQ